MIHLCLHTRKDVNKSIHSLNSTPYIRNACMHILRKISDKENVDSLQDSTLTSTSVSQRKPGKFH